ncbi:hypothetical protein Glove_294g172 [Diversispora epigaea]|uniref:SAM domain-containing protein n=1 Tax=Diversispora epigaea TaxID=1348612 RepID=A0A397I067_9GLOM|nr:hypothetical protein Glove_294g172 [Diversispora epigaea]
MSEQSTSTTKQKPDLEMVRKYNTEQLITFFRKKEDLQLNDTHFEILRNEEITGRFFLLITEQEFKHYGMKGGPATRLVDFAKEIKEEQPVVAKRAKFSIDSISDLERIISADECPITLIPFVSRPQIEDKVCELIDLNLINIPSPRTQDYRGIVISSGNGTGKTRIGFEINNISERNEIIKKNKNRLKATFEHIYININEIKSLLGPGLNDDINNKYERIPEHINKASILLRKFIAIYFLTKVWKLDKIKECIDLIYDSIKYDEVVEFIRKEKKLDTSVNLILFLQIDEFQFENYITSRHKKYTTSFSVTDYTMGNVNLSPMNFEDSMSLFNRFTKHYNDNNSDILPEKGEKFYRCVVNSIRGIPVIIEIAVKLFLNLKVEGISVFQSYDTVSKYWEYLKNKVSQKYSYELWRSSLHNNDNIRKLLYYIHIQKRISKRDKLNECTIKEMETSGLIYLDETNERNIFIPRAPLILIVILVDFFNLHIFFDNILLNPFILINQDNFPDFILRIHHATYGLMICNGIEQITLKEIYGQHIIGPEEVLNHEICVNTIEYYEQPPLVPKDSSNEQFTKSKLYKEHRKHLEVICSEDVDRRGYREIDATSSRYIIKIRRKSPLADAILPHADEQYKYSETLKSKYPVYTSKTEKLSAKNVRIELEKALGTGADRLVIVTPKKFEGNIPENCAIVAGIDFVNFIVIYADLVARICRNN